MRDYIYYGKDMKSIINNTINRGIIILFPISKLSSTDILTYSVWPPMNSRMMEVGGMAAISEGCRAVM